jgi:hypothetical protein
VGSKTTINHPFEEKMECGCVKRVDRDEFTGAVVSITLSPCEKAQEDFTNAYKEVVDRGESIFNLLP